MTPGSGEMDDRIHIHELELWARVGVPDEERAAPQRLTVSLTLWPLGGFGQMHDEIERTVNYAAVCDAVKHLVATRTDKLIETLAEAIASEILRAFPVTRIRLELRKFILPDTAFVAVALERERTIGG
jgi:dihydroneopterin aldolase